MKFGPDTNIHFAVKKQKQTKNSSGAKFGMAK